MKLSLNSILVVLLLELRAGLQDVLILIRGEHVGVPTTLIGSKKLFSIAPASGFRLYSVASFAKGLSLVLPSLEGRGGAPGRPARAKPMEEARNKNRTPGHETVPGINDARNRLL